MSLKWKCVDSHFLSLNPGTPDTGETDVSGIGKQSRIPVIQEVKCSRFIELREYDTKDKISDVDLGGYTVSNETCNVVPSTQLLPLDAEPTEQYIKEEPLEDTLEYCWDNDACEDVVVKCEIIDKTEASDPEETDIDMEGQSVSIFERDNLVKRKQHCSSGTELTECDTKSGISIGEVGGYTISNETYNTMSSPQLFPHDAEGTEQYIKHEPVEDTWEYYRINDAGEYVLGKFGDIDNRVSCDSATERQIPKKCIKCAECFDSMLDLKRHMVDSHVDMKKLTCLLCGKSFSKNSGLHRHMFVHIDEKPYRCSKCYRSFRFNDTLTSHMLTHNGEKLHGTNTNEHTDKLANRKRYKSKACTNTLEKELLSIPGADTVSQQDSEVAEASLLLDPTPAQNISLSLPRPQQVGLRTMSLQTPSQVVDTPGKAVERCLDSKQQQKIVAPCQFSPSSQQAIQQNPPTEFYHPPSATASRPPVDDTYKAKEMAQQPQSLFGLVLPGRSSASHYVPVQEQPVDSMPPVEITKHGSSLPPEKVDSDISLALDVPLKPKKKDFKEKGREKRLAAHVSCPSSQEEQHSTGQDKHLWQQHSPKTWAAKYPMKSRESPQARGKRSAKKSPESMPHSTKIYRDYWEFMKKRMKERKKAREMYLEPEEGLSDIRSQYTQDIDSIRWLLDMPDPVATVPNSFALDEKKCPKVPSNCLPVHPIVLSMFQKFEADFKASNLPEGKFINPPAPTGKWYKTFKPVFEEKMQELNRDFSRICISPKPKGPSWGHVPMHVLKQLEHQARANISTLNYSATFVDAMSECNSSIDAYRSSLKTLFKKAVHQISKGADPHRVMESTYDRFKYYHKLLDSRLFIQHRALVCQSRALGHMLHRNLYVIGISGLMRRDVEMSNLHPDLTDDRRRNLRNSPFMSSDLFKSELIPEYEDFLLKKAASKSTFSQYQSFCSANRAPGKVRYRRKRNRGPSSPSSSYYQYHRERYSNRGRGQFRNHYRGRGRGAPSRY